MSDTLQGVSNSQTSERRSHPREKTVCPFVELDNDNGGVVLNVSERGLAIQVVQNLPEDPFQRLRFQLPESGDWFETWGRIAWTGPSKRTAGLEFVDFSKDGETRIRSWVSSMVQTNITEEKKAPTRKPASYTFPEARPGRLDFDSRLQDHGTRHFC